jgi:glycerate dehydrogenase
MKGVILDSSSLGDLVDLTPITTTLTEWQVYPFTRAKDILPRIRDAQIILTNKILLDRTAFEQNPQIELVSIMATGSNNIDLIAARNSGVTVCNAIAYATPSVVQHTLTLLLNLFTSMPRYLTDTQEGRWQQSDVFCRLDHPIIEIMGKTLGIVGLGELGHAVALAARSLGMEVIAANSSGKKRAATPAMPGTDPIPRVTLNELLERADVVSLHCPLTTDNDQFINADKLALMRSEAFLINTARGGLVDSQALIDALANNQLAGAAVDVLDQEPATANEPLLNHPNLNLLITPHNAWGALESRQRLIVQMQENITHYLNKAPVRMITGPALA